MTRTLLSGLAAVAMLAVLADTPANAQQFRQQSGAYTSNSGGNAAAKRQGRTRSRPQGSQQLSSGQQPTSAVNPSALLALSILRRKCLDNILPECP